MKKPDARIRNVADSISPLKPHVDRMLADLDRPHS